MVTEAVGHLRWGDHSPQSATCIGGMEMAGRSKKYGPADYAFIFVVGSIATVLGLAIGLAAEPVVGQDLAVWAGVAVVMGVVIAAMPVWLWWLRRRGRR